MARESLMRTVVNEARGAGLDLRLVSSDVEQDDIGDGEVVFLVEPIFLKFSRDRGQDFVDLAPVAHPDPFHMFDDVEIALGWKSVDEILAKQEPEPLSKVLGRIAARMDELRNAFAPERAATTIQQIQSASRSRGEAFMAKLR